MSAFADSRLGTAQAPAGESLRPSGTVISCAATTPVECVLPASPLAPKLARLFLGRTACSDHCTDRGDPILLVSELVTNALLHGVPPIGLTVQCAGTRLIVGVTDAGQRPIILPAEPTGADAPSGRGLFLLQALAGDWGIRTHARGTTVWFSV